MSTAKAMRDGRAESIRVKTLGQVAGLVVEELFAAPDSESTAPDEIIEPWFGFSFRIDSDPDEVAASYKTLNALIAERNDLVHHLLSRWNLQDADSCSALSAELDQQRARVTREIERYRAYANTVGERAGEIQAFFDSDAGKRQFDVMYLQSSRLAIC